MTPRMRMRRPASLSASLQTTHGLSAAPQITEASSSGCMRRRRRPHGGSRCRGWRSSSSRACLHPSVSRPLASSTRTSSERECSHPAAAAAQQQHQHQHQHHHHRTCASRGRQCLPKPACRCLLSSPSLAPRPSPISSSQACKRGRPQSAHRHLWHLAPARPALAHVHHALAGAQPVPAALPGSRGAAQVCPLRGAPLQWPA